jgi:hypothetical protein
MQLALFIALSSCLLALIPLGVIRAIGTHCIRTPSTIGTRGRLAKVLEF